MKRSTPLQVAAKALFDQMGIKKGKGREVPEGNYATYGFNYPGPHHATFPNLPFEVSLLWNPEEDSLILTTILDTCSLPSADKEGLETYFVGLSRSVRPFLPLPQSILESCFLNGVLLEDGRGPRVVPAFLVEIGYAQLTEDDIRSNIGILFECSTRALSFSRRIFDEVSEGKFPGPVERIQEINLQCSLWNFAKDDEDPPQSEKESHTDEGVESNEPNLRLN